MNYRRTFSDIEMKVVTNILSTFICVVIFPSWVQILIIKIQTGTYRRPMICAKCNPNGGEIDLDCSIVYPQKRPPPLDASGNNEL